MTEGPSLSARPSLTGAAPVDTGTAPRDTAAGGRLLDLMFDGFYLLVLLKRGQLPNQADTFASEIQNFLEGVERSAMKSGIASEDIYAAKYAFCAAVDEVILSQPTPFAMNGSAIRCSCAYLAITWRVNTSLIIWKICEPRVPPDWPRWRFITIACCWDSKANTGLMAAKSWVI